MWIIRLVVPFVACQVIASCSKLRGLKSSLPLRESLRLESGPGSKMVVGMEKRMHEEPKKIRKEIEEEFDMAVDAPRTSYRMTQNNFHTIFVEYMPGYTFHLRTNLTAMVCMMLSSMWFLLYFLCIYKSDRAEDHRHWKQEGFCMEKVAGGDKERHDFVLVFHHPEHDHEDKDTICSPESVQQCFVRNDCKTKHSPREGQTITSLADIKVRDEVTYQSMRCSFLQDVHTTLQESGFDVKIYSSIDDDELFLCASVVNEDVIDHYLLKNRLRLQIKPDVVAKLGIQQPEEEHASSTPSLCFNQADIEALYDQKIISSPDKEALYVPTNSGSGVVLSADRIRWIYKELSLAYDLDAAKKHGLLVDWFPAHQSRKRLEKLYRIWGDWHLLKDTSFVQPMPTIKNYFGARVAFNFEWNGTYAKSLFALLPVALSSSIAISVLSHFGYSVAQLTRCRIIVFSVILAVWSRLAFNMWLREKCYFMTLWDLHRNSGGLLVRPQFQGTPGPSPVNLRDEEKQASVTSSMILLVLSMLVTLTYSVCVGSIVLAFMHSAIATDGRMSLSANFFLVMQVQIFQFIYNKLAIYLTDFENHKFNPAYYHSYLWKQMFFQFVNYYTPFFYLTVEQPRSAIGCPKEGCIAQLQYCLNASLAFLCCFRVGEVIFRACVVKYTLQEESSRVRAHGIGSSMDSSSHSWPEEQAKYGQFRLPEQIEFMLELVLALGFVLLFSSVATVGPVIFCLLVFIIQLRTSAYFLTTLSKRPMPRSSFGIGAWEDIVALLMNIGIVFSAFLVVNFDESFTDAKHATRLMGFIILSLLMFSTWPIVDMCCPAEDGEADLLARRRAYTLTKFMKRTGHIAKARMKRINTDAAWSDSPPREIAPLEWDTFPHFDGTPVIRKSNMN